MYISIRMQDSMLKMHTNCIYVSAGMGSGVGNMEIIFSRYITIQATNVFL